MLYTDSIGRIHDKPTDGAFPSSNNGWLYTAVYKKLGGVVRFDRSRALECAEQLKRHPSIYDAKAPPISRDEVLGLVYLGVMKPEHLENWSFSPFPLPKFNFVKLIQQIKQARGQDRNYFWENNLDQLYRFAFSVPLQDRHFILSRWGKYNLFYHLIHVAYSLIPPKTASSSQIRYLKTGLGKKNLLKYHQDIAHPINMGVHGEF